MLNFLEESRGRELVSFTPTPRHTQAFTKGPIHFHSHIIHFPATRDACAHKKLFSDYCRISYEHISMRACIIRFNPLISLCTQCHTNIKLFTTTADQFVIEIGDWDVLQESSGALDCGTDCAYLGA